MILSGTEADRPCQQQKDDNLRFRIAHMTWDDSIVCKAFVHVLESGD